VYYGQAAAYLAPHVARCCENSLCTERRLWDYEPSEQITVLLHDLADYKTGSATTTPYNRVLLAMSPPSYAFETLPSNEAINATLNHELTHIAVTDRASGQDRLFRTILSGKVRETSEQPLTILYGYLTQPRRSAPQWFHEGIAVFVDTWMAGGLGRALGCYDEMVFRSAVQERVPLYDLIGLESDASRNDFQVGQMSYLYGTRFMSYLALQYGPESLIAWAGRTDGSRAYFASQFRKVYGTSLEAEWSRWLKWEHEFQQANLEAIRSFPTTPYRPAGAECLGMVSRACYDPARRTMYTAVNAPGQVAYIAEIDINDGSLRRLGEIKRPAMYAVSSLAYDPASGTLFFTTDNDEWRDLHALDVQTGQKRTLVKQARLGDLAFNQADHSVWGVRHANGISSLVRLAPPYNKLELVAVFPYGWNVHSPSISPDGQLLAAGLAEVTGRQTLIMAATETLRQGNTQHRVLFDFGNSIPAGFVWTPDGRALVGTSYYTGISNLYRYDVATDVMQAASNCETGFFNPLPISNDSAVVFRYTSAGFEPVLLEVSPVDDVAAIAMLGQEVVETHPVVRDWMVGSPGDITLDTAVTRHGAYSGIGNVRLASAYPVVEGYQAWPAYGARVELRDPIGLHAFDATASYTPNSDVPTDERLHVDLGYTRVRWRARFRANRADFYDLFGPTKTSRKGYSFVLDYDGALVRDYPREMYYRLGGAAYWSLERLPEYQNITVSYDRFFTFDAGIGYTHRRGSLGAVDYEKGRAWNVAGNANVVNGKVFTKWYGTFDLGLPLPLDHSSVWFRLATGFSPDPRTEPLANFYFGGFGNNWVDRGSIQRYRQFYTFPGTELNEVGGTSFVRLLTEWSLPPLSFRRVGRTSLYATWLRTDVFAGVLSTNLGDASRDRMVYNVGLQVDLRLTLLSHLPMTLSGGAAAAFEKDRPPSSEIMVSLKVL